MPGVTPNEARQLISTPQLNRLKDLGMGFKMGATLGRRVLVQPVEPFTEMDEVEKKGLLHIPESVKKQNTPLPTTGVVLSHGHLLTDQERALMPEGCGIMFGKYSGTECVVAHVTYRIVPFDEILCTVVDAESPEAYAVTVD